MLYLSHYLFDPDLDCPNRVAIAADAPRRRWKSSSLGRGVSFFFFFIYFVENKFQAWWSAWILFSIETRHKNVVEL